MNFAFDRLFTLHNLSQFWSNSPGWITCLVDRIPNFGNLQELTHTWLNFSVHDRSLLRFGTAWCSRLTRFVGARWLHLQGKENYSKFMQKFCLWGRQTQYIKFAQPVARRQHVACDTVLCCPRKHLEWDKALHPLSWQSRNGTPEQFWKLWAV